MLHPQHIVTPSHHAPFMPICPGTPPSLVLPTTAASQTHPNRLCANLVEPTCNLPEFTYTTGGFA